MRTARRAGFALLALAACTQDASLGRLAARGAAGDPNASPPGEGTGVFPQDSDVNPAVCEGSGVAFAVTADLDLYSIDLASAATSRVGRIACGARRAGPPPAIAIDRLGVAWVVVDAGGESSLWRASTRDAHCIASLRLQGWAPGSVDAIGFVGDAHASTSETLYVVAHGTSGSPTRVIASADPSTGETSPVGMFASPMPTDRVLLAGDWEATLYALAVQAPVSIDGEETMVVTSRHEPSGVVRSTIAARLDSAVPVGFAARDDAFSLVLVPTGSSRVTTASLARLGADGSVTIARADLGFLPSAASGPACAPPPPNYSEKP